MSREKEFEILYAPGGQGRSRSSPPPGPENHQGEDGEPHHP